MGSSDVIWCDFEQMQQVQSFIPARVYQSFIWECMLNRRLVPGIKECMVFNSLWIQDNAIPTYLGFG